MLTGDSSVFLTFHFASSTRDGHSAPDSYIRPKTYIYIYFKYCQVGHLDLDIFCGVWATKCDSIMNELFHHLASLIFLDRQSSSYWNDELLGILVLIRKKKKF